MSEIDETEDFLEQDIGYGFVLWHIVFLASGIVLSIVIFLCCCIKFRIPRTKQEIEADYIRKKILKKFQRRLKTIQNQDLDEMDLKRALDKIRAEFMSDTESLAQSEARFSVGSFSLSTAPGDKVYSSSTHRGLSHIAIASSLEDQLIHPTSIAGRLSAAFSKFCGRSKVGQTTPTSPTRAAPSSSKVTLPLKPMQVATPKKSRPQIPEEK